MVQRSLKETVLTLRGMAPKEEKLLPTVFISMLLITTKMTTNQFKEDYTSTANLLKNRMHV